CTLIVTPQGATNIMYAEIYSATVQEDVTWLNPTGGFGEFHATITWTRSPFFGMVSAGETLLNGVTFTNTGTGVNNNTQAFATGSGDLIYEGQPLNIFTNVYSQTAARFYLGSVKSRTYDTTSAGAYSTTSTTGVNVAGASEIVTDPF